MAPTMPHTILYTQVEELQTVAESKQCEVEELKMAESKHLEMLHKLEESCRALECERLRERTELCSRLHNSEVWPQFAKKRWLIVDLGGGESEGMKSLKFTTPTAVGGIPILILLVEKF